MEYIVKTYKLRVRIHVEQHAPLWMFSLTKAWSDKIERFQKTALYIILGKHAHREYSRNLATLNLKPLEQRRLTIAKRFAAKILKHPEHRKIFNIVKPNTRSGNRIEVPKCRTKRYKKSTVPALANIINRELKDKI